MCGIEIGYRFGRLVVEAAAPANGYRRRWFCRCDCGVVKAFDHSNLRAGFSKSCGCLKRDQNKERSFALTHGRNKTPEHRSWSGMIQRCTNPNMDSWPDYGGRGIAVCERWRNSFEAFLADVGERPSPAHSLDRIDPNGNYEPGNCRWATRAQQAQGRRTTVLSWDIVNEIRGRSQHGESRKSIAKRMGLRSNVVGRIVRNLAWKEAA